MRCPLLSIACAVSQLPLDELTDDCLKGECAWWDEVPKRCLVFSIRSELFILNELIQKRWERK